jgi:hypothetical protein
VFGSVAAASVIGAAVSQIVTTMADKALDDLTHQNVDTFLSPDGVPMKEVEDVIARWARPELAAQVSADLHNTGRYEGGGPYLVAYGRAYYEWDTRFKVRWEHGVYDWAIPERLGGLAFAAGLGVAGKEFLRSLAYGVSLYQSRRAKEATAKAALVAVALQIVRNPSLSRFAGGVNRVAISVVQPLPAYTAINTAAISQTAAGPGVGAVVLNRNAYAATLPAPVVVAGGAGLLGLVWWLWRFL